MRGGPSSPKDDWPPSDFRHKTGTYKKLSRPSESSARALDEIVRNRRVIAEVAPQDDDEVVVNGNQLHRLLRHKQILHLFYAGFAANICVPFKDYGMRAMKDRGYEIILIRDCTTAIETADTIEHLNLTKNAVRDTELNIGYTVSSSELMETFRNAT
jgi:nicotinamidase-related amidase